MLDSLDASGRLAASSEKAVSTQIRELYHECEQDAFRVLRASQIELISRKHFRRIFDASPTAFFQLPYIQETLQIPVDFVSKARQVEKKSNESLTKIKERSKARIVNLNQRKLEEILKVLTPDQKEEFKKLLDLRKE